MFVSGDNTPAGMTSLLAGPVWCPMFLVGWHIGSNVPSIYIPLGWVLAPAALIAGKR